MYLILKKDTKKKKNCGISQVTKYFRERFRNKPQIQWFLGSVFARASPFRYFFHLLSAILDSEQKQ